MQRSFKIISVLGVLALIMMAVALWQYLPSAETDGSADLMMLPKLPRLPCADQVVVPGNVLKLSAPEQPQLEDKVLQLIASARHPDMKDAEREIRSGALWLRFRMAGTASFGFWPKSNRLDETPKALADYHPALILDYHRTCQASSPQELGDLLVSIRHEYVHRQEVIGLSGDDLKRFWRWLPMRFLGQLTPEQCETVWKSERAAYVQECEAMIGWGFVDSRQLCQKLPEPAKFNTKLLIGLSDRTTFPECADAWHALARAAP